MKIGWIYIYTQYVYLCIEDNYDAGFQGTDMFFRVFASSRTQSESTSCSTCNSYTIDGASKRRAAPRFPIYHPHCSPFFHVHGMFFAIISSWKYPRVFHHFHVGENPRKNRHLRSESILVEAPRWGNPDGKGWGHRHVNCNIVEEGWFVQRKHHENTTLQKNLAMVLVVVLYEICSWALSEDDEF